MSALFQPTSLYFNITTGWFFSTWNTWWFFHLDTRGFFPIAVSGGDTKGRTLEKPQQVVRSTGPLILLVFLTNRRIIGDIESYI